MLKREALLKPAYSEWYPTLLPGIWYPADSVREAVLQQLRSSEPRWQPNGRVPSDQHFAFRGGISEPRRDHGNNECRAVV
jgi:hypothetical protein